MKKALALNPKLPGVELNLGLAEFKQERSRPPPPPFVLSWRRSPRTTRRARFFGISYYGAQRFPDAIQSLELASKSDPDNSELHRLLAQSCLWAKNYPCALEKFRQLLQLGPRILPRPTY